MTCTMLFEFKCSRCWGTASILVAKNLNMYILQITPVPLPAEAPGQWAAHPAASRAASLGVLLQGPTYNSTSSPDNTANLASPPAKLVVSHPDKAAPSEETTAAGTDGPFTALSSSCVYATSQATILSSALHHLSSPPRPPSELVQHEAVVPTAANPPSLQQGSPIADDPNNQTALDTGNQQQTPPQPIVQPPDWWGTPLSKEAASGSLVCLDPAKSSPIIHHPVLPAVVTAPPANPSELQENQADKEAASFYSSRWSNCSDMSSTGSTFPVSRRITHADEPAVPLQKLLRKPSLAVTVQQHSAEPLAAMEAGCEEQQAEPGPAVPSIGAINQCNPFNSSISNSSISNSNSRRTSISSGPLDLSRSSSTIYPYSRRVTHHNEPAVSISQLTKRASCQITIHEPQRSTAAGPGVHSLPSHPTAAVDESALVHSSNSSNALTYKISSSAGSRRSSRSSDPGVAIDAKLLKTSGQSNVGPEWYGLSSVPEMRPASPFQSDRAQPYQTALQTHSSSAVSGMMSSSRSSASYRSSQCGSSRRTTLTDDEPPYTLEGALDSVISSSNISIFSRPASAYGSRRTSSTCSSTDRESKSDDSEGHAQVYCTAYLETSALLSLLPALVQRQRAAYMFSDGHV